MSPLASYLCLFAAIALEVAGTSALQASQQFTRLVPTLIMAACYGAAFFALSFVLKMMPIGLAYAIWSGLGIVLISAIGFFAFRQKLDAPALIGLGFIIVGVIIVNAFSKAAAH